MDIKEFFKVMLDKMDFDENQTEDFVRGIKLYTEIICNKQKEICTFNAEVAQYTEDCIGYSHDIIEVDKPSILNSPIVKVE